jgi:hypothetical protein
MIAKARCSMARRYCSRKSGYFASHLHTVPAAGIFVGLHTARRLLPLAIPAQISVVSLELYMLRRPGLRFAFAGGAAFLRIALLIRVPPPVVPNRRKTKRPRAAARRAFETHKYIVAKYINSL